MKTYGLWVIADLSANQLGQELTLWGKRRYGLREVWVTRGSTVYVFCLREVRLYMYLSATIGRWSLTSYPTSHRCHL
jgi:hypothetical protein